MEEVAGQAVERLPRAYRMTELFVENPLELWEICGRVGGPKIGWGAFLLRFSMFLSENGNRLGTGGLGDIFILGRSYMVYSREFFRAVILFVPPSSIYVPALFLLAPLHSSNANSIPVVAF